MLAGRVIRSLGVTLVAALLAMPFALAWAIAHAQVEDYLGPHRVTFAANYSSEIEFDLGPLGNAYLPSPAAPIGLQLVVGGVGSASGSEPAFFSTQTLASYSTLYAEPDEALAGVVERLAEDVLLQALKAEVVALLVFALWVLRRQLLAPRWVSPVSWQRIVAIYALVVAVTAGSILAPPEPRAGVRLRVAVTYGTPFGGLTVDSVLLADVLDRGIKGVRLLSSRQQKAVASYIEAADNAVRSQVASLPAPLPGETMLLGYSDLHCNQPMTELITRLVDVTEPAQVLSSGDDTVHGTAAERGCIRREAQIASEPPVVVATGNHDSDTTESQMRGQGMTVLDGAVVQSGGLTILGDDDPERNIPFSVERVPERPETEAQLAERLLDTARGQEVDVLLMHQPAASVVVMTSANPPARLVLWGHFHSQTGPTVISHDDGSWTVGVQQGTAGGVRQPTFTSFSTPFTPPLINADVYFYFRDEATGLITGVQPLHFKPDASVVIDQRIQTGNLETLPAETRAKLGGASPAPTIDGPS